MEAQLRDGNGEERQPAPRRFVISDERGTSRGAAESATWQTLEVWTGQEPGERIANTILLCAIRDRAHQVTLEPDAKGVKVRFQIENGVREQKLPAFALAPIVRHFKTLASDTRFESASADDGADADDAATPPDVLENRELSGQVAVAVDEQFFHVSFSPLLTECGVGVKVQFSSFHRS